MATLRGEGSPIGRMAPKGTIYADTLNSTAYVNTGGDGNSWRNLFPPISVLTTGTTSGGTTGSTSGTTGMTATSVSVIIKHPVLSFCLPPSADNSAQPIFISNTSITSTSSIYCSLENITTVAGTIIPIVYNIIPYNGYAYVVIRNLSATAGGGTCNFNLNIRIF